MPCSITNVGRRASARVLLACAAAMSLLAFTAAARAQYFSAAPIRDPDHIFQQDVQSWTRLKQRNIVMQRQDYSCGAAALATVARYYWGDMVDEAHFLNTIIAMLSPAKLEDRVKNGLTMTDLRLAAVKLGYTSTIGRLSYEELTESRVPLIVSITVRGLDHFVVYRGTDGYYVYLADPVRGNIRIPAWEFVEQWQNNAVLVVAKPGAGVRDWSPLSVTCEETMLGETNRQYVRRNALTPPRFGPLLRLAR